MDLFKQDFSVSSQTSANLQNTTQEKIDFGETTNNKLIVINNPNNTDLISPDRNIVVSALKLIISTLEDDQTIEDINDSVIENVLKLGNSKDDEIIADVVEIISYITIAPDKILKRYLYLQPSFKQVLLHIISTTRNKTIITNSLNALCEMINEKLETIESIDGGNLFKASLFILSKCRKNKFKQECQPALILLAKCLCFFEAPPEIIVDSTNEILRFLNSRINFIKPFIIRLINTISYYQPERTLNYFSNEIIHFVHLFTNQNFDSTPYAENIFGTLNNMVFKSDEFAVYLPSSTPLFEIPVNPNWHERILQNYIQLQDTIFRRLKLVDKNEENWGKAISNIRKYADSILMIGISLLGSSSFRLKKTVVSMFCQLILLNDTQIFRNIFPKYIDLFTILIEYFEFNDAELTHEIAITIYLLCKSSPINGDIDVFDVLMKTDGVYIVQNLLSDTEIDPDILRIINQIQQMIPDNLP